MSSESKAPPIVAFASHVYGQYFDDTGTEDKLNASIKAFGAAHEYERRFTEAHLQYLQLQQLGRVELFLAQLVSEAREIRRNQATMTPAVEDIHQAMIDVAEMMTSMGAPMVDPDAPLDPLPGDIDELEPEDGDLPPGVEVLDTSNPGGLHVLPQPGDDPDPDSGHTSRARPMSTTIAPT